jgi:CheY-like chemotaxis protein
MAKILVIDDDPAMRRATGRALETAGHVVAVHENGRSAVRDIDKDPPDLLITDIFMPEMEGLETIRQARSRQPTLPIIAMSGFSFEERDYLAIAEKFGAVASLRKPFRPAELIALVSRLLAEPRGSSPA